MTTPAEPTLLDTLIDIVEGMAWQPRGPQVVALAVLGQPAIADGLRASETLAAIRGLHPRRTWQDGTTVVCAACNTAWPCPTMAAAGEP